DRLRRILVWPGGTQKVEEPIVVDGEMDPSRRARLHAAIKLRRQTVYVPTGRGITPQIEASLAELPHVAEVRPALVLQGRITVEGSSVRGLMYTASGTDESLTRRLLAGSNLRGGQEALLLSEYVAYRAGLSETQLLGRQATIEVETASESPVVLLQMLNLSRPDLTDEQRNVLDQLMRRLPELLLRLELPADEAKLLRDLILSAPRAAGEGLKLTLPVCGVFRDVEPGELSPWDAGPRPVEVYLPAEVARRLYLARPGRTNRDLPSVIVLVDQEENVRLVQQRIKDMGLETFSLAELLDQVRFNLRILVGVLSLLALLALGIAALSIANTMTMAILQRTHEIGVLKALGATDWQVRILFLSEGVVIGAVGGLVGMLAGWLTAWPGNAFARWLLEAQTPMRLEESVFVYPWWLLLGTPLLALVGTALAAWWPAVRAARIDPVAALRER
ncbi:MAG: FtsX-like permease family protein, partial [Gemmataceae bacterium]